MLQTIWLFILAHWHAMAATVVVTGFLRWFVSFFTGEKAADFVRAELEKVRADLKSNSLTGQLACDDALVNLCEATIPVILHESGDELQQAIANGSIASVNWIDFGKKLWAEIKPIVEGGVHDYLQNSSHEDGEKLAAMVSKRFFVAQKMAAKGLIVDAPRAEVTDVSKTTVTIPGQTVTSDVHTEVGK